MRGDPTSGRRTCDREAALGCGRAAAGTGRLGVWGASSRAALCATSGGDPDGDFAAPSAMAAVATVPAVSNAPAISPAVTPRNNVRFT